MKNILIEALSSRQRKIANELAHGYDPYKAHVEMFDDYEKSHPHRIFIDATHDNRLPPEEIVQHLAKHGYSVENYGRGLASKTFKDINGNSKQQIYSIGKVLQRTGAKEVNTSHINKKGGLKNLMELYNDSRDGANSHLQLAITRDVDDIAGMSTGRHWESCMNLDSGCNMSKIKDDYNHHSLVAYLVNKGDDDIEAPLGRMLIKKYVNDNGHEIYRAVNRPYGNFPVEFNSAINNVMRKYYPSKQDGGAYKIHPELYSDSADDYIERRGIVKNGNEISHYNDHGLLHDYIDENGIHQPAIIKGNKKHYYSNGLLHREQGQPAIINSSGKEYYIHGMLHREGDLPAIDHKDKKAYYKFNQLHRDGNKPANLEYNSQGDLFREQYYKNGLEHREDNKPSSIINDFWTGATKTVSYKVNGEFHRDGDLPADIVYGDGKSIEREGYYKNGLLHREGNKPAFSMNRPNHIRESYCINGELHRDGDEPACVEIKKSDGITKKEIKFFKHGVATRDGYKPYHSIVHYENDEPFLEQYSYHNKGDDKKPIEVKINRNKEHVDTYSRYRPLDTVYHPTETFERIRNDGSKVITKSFLHNVSDKPTKIEYSYDEDGKLYSDYKEYSNIGEGLHKVTKYYHPNGRVSSENLKYELKSDDSDNPHSVIKEYDENGNLTGTSESYNKSSDYSKPIKIVNKDGIISKTYNRLNGIENTVHDKNGKLLSYTTENGLSLGYDKDGNPAFSNGKVTVFSKNNQLMAFNRTSKEYYNIENGLVYDKNGKVVDVGIHQITPLKHYVRMYKGNFLDNRHLELTKSFNSEMKKQEN